MKYARVIVGLVGVVLTLCVTVVGLARCTDTLMCAVDAGGQVAVRGAIVISLIAAVVTTSLILIRTAHLLVGMQMRLTRLPQAHRAPLTRSLAHTALPFVSIASAVPLVFVAGSLRPRIYCTTGLAGTLPADELDAVLRHEQVHVQARDPLRHAVRHAVADVLFFLPVARWWWQQGVDMAEVAADRRALEHHSPAVLARALWTSGGGGCHLSVADLRLSQLERAHVTKPKVPQSVMAQSLAGAGAVMVVLLCALPLI